MEQVIFKVYKKFTQLAFKNSSDYFIIHNSHYNLEIMRISTMGLLYYCR